MAKNIRGVMVKSLFQLDRRSCLEVDCQRYGMRNMPNAF